MVKRPLLNEQKYQDSQLRMENWAVCAENDLQQRSSHIRTDSTPPLRTTKCFRKINKFIPFREILFSFTLNLLSWKTSAALKKGWYCSVNVFGLFGWDKHHKFFKSRKLQPLIKYRTQQIKWKDILDQSAIQGFYSWLRLQKELWRSFGDLSHSFMPHNHSQKVTKERGKILEWDRRHRGALTTVSNI